MSDYQYHDSCFINFFIEFHNKYILNVLSAEVKSKEQGKSEVIALITHFIIVYHGLKSALAWRVIVIYITLKFQKPSYRIALIEFLA